jgi:hypothetical protein
VKGKLPNVVGSQYSSHYLGTLLPLMRTPRLPAVDRTDAPADLNGHVRFAERRNLVYARVPSYFNAVYCLHGISTPVTASSVTLGTDPRNPELRTMSWIYERQDGTHTLSRSVNNKLPIPTA